MVQLLYHLNCDHQIQLHPIHYYFLTYFKHGGRGFDLWIPWCSSKSKVSTGKSSYVDFAIEQAGELCSKLCWYHWHRNASACQYSFWNTVTFGAAKFQVDVKERGRGLWPKRPVDIKWGKSEYVDSPYRCDYNTNFNSFFPRWKWEWKTMS